MKLQVNVSEELVKELDRYAAMMGVSRSALCAVFIGQGVMTYQKSFDMINVIGSKIGDTLLLEKMMKEPEKDLLEIVTNKKKRGK